MSVVWGLLRRRPGAPSGPLEWLGSDDLEWTDRLEDAELVATVSDGKVLVQAEVRRGQWVRLPFAVEFRAIEGEPKPCPEAEVLAQWALGRIPEPEVLLVEQVASLVASDEEPF